MFFQHQSARKRKGSNCNPDWRPVYLKCLSYALLPYHTVNILLRGQLVSYVVEHEYLFLTFSLYNQLSLRMVAHIDALIAPRFA